jgi:rhodanese-related sulfurtransferase
VRRQSRSGERKFYAGDAAAGDAVRQARVAGGGLHGGHGRATRSFYNHHSPQFRTAPLQFFFDPIVWLLILAALVSGGLLLWPTLNKARSGGVSPTEAVRLINREKATVIDVSEPGEFAAGHVVGSRNIPIGRLEVAPELPKNKTLPVVLVCATGKRAAKAAKALEAKGYAKPVVLAGGLAAWKAANLPVETSAAPT